MQYSIVKKSDVFNHRDIRIDPEFYKPFFIHFFKNVKNWEPLGNYIDVGYRVVYENTQILDLSSDKESQYTRFLQASDIETPYINVNRIGFVSNEDWERYPKGRVKRGELLIEVKGKAEKVAIVPADFPEKTLVTGSLYKASINKQKSKEFLLVYLLCKYGSDFKERAKTNLLISFINKNDLYEIPVPLFKSLESIIESTYNSLVALLDLSRRLYSQAETLLLSELGLLDWRAKHALSFVRNYSETQQARRLDAEYFQPKYDEIVKAIKNYKGGWDTLGNLVSVKKCVEVGSEEYLDEGIPFVRVSNLSPFEITEEKYISEKLYSELTQHQPKQGEILFTKDATPGIAYHLNEKPQKMIPSGGILRLKLKDNQVNEDYLTLMLNSLTTKEQINRDVGGSVILHWRPDQVKQILIPILDKNKQNQIRQKITESFRLRNQSKHLLECAKKAVEMAIEKNEQAAIKWIKEQGYFEE